MANPNPMKNMAPVSKDVIAVDYVQGICVATVLVTELNSANSEELSSSLLALLNDGKSKRFVVDLEMVRFMESSCFGALVTFLKWLSRFDGKIALANVTENVRFLFAVTKLDKAFPLHKDVPSALAFLSAPMA
jgi:anti-sigma B factor antagonist